jgi:putative DNA primase/helicase
MDNIEEATSATFKEGAAGPPLLSVENERLSLLRNGYPPVPVKTGQKNPMALGWQIISKNADEPIVLSWKRKMRACRSTGILTGEVVGVDIDVQDEALASKIEALAYETLGPTPLKRIGRAPKRLLTFRTLNPFNKIDGGALYLGDQKQKIEVLGQGQQFVAFGTHPETQRPYQWIGPTPCDVPLNQLPIVTKEQCKEFVAKANAILRNAGAKEKSPAEIATPVKSNGRDTGPATKDKVTNVGFAADQRLAFQANVYSLKPREKDVLDCLTHISSDPRDIWIRVGLAIKHGFGEDGFDMWDEWSSTSDKYEGADATRKTWDGLKPTGKVTCASIFWLARQGMVAKAEAAGELILDRQDPCVTAEHFVAKYYLLDGVPALRRYQDTFYGYTGTHYAEIRADEMRVRIYKFLNPAWHLPANGPKVKFKPTIALVNNVIDALKALTNLTADTSAPTWLEGAGDYPAQEMLACSNGLLHMPTRTLLPHTPLFFSLNALGFAFDASATAPRFEKFQLEIFPDDPESRDTLLEELGYLLASDTSQQKIFLWVGATRSGKGTLARVLTELLGSANVCAPTLKLLGQPNGAEVLIGKQVAIMSDVKQGRNTDSAAWSELMMTISGEDRVSLGRKYKSAWEGGLPLRFLLLANKIPNLPDASSAFVGRFVVLVFRISFLGREDRGLTASLLTELPGILNRALDGRDRLAKRGRFVQPQSATDEVEVMAELGSPISAFLADCCILGENESVPHDELYRAYRDWSAHGGRDYPVTAAQFGVDLHAAMPRGLKSQRPRTDDGKRPRKYLGIGLRGANKPGIGQAQAFISAGLPANDSKSFRRTRQRRSAAFDTATMDASVVKVADALITADRVKNDGRSRRRSVPGPRTDGTKK